MNLLKNLSQQVSPKKDDSEELKKLHQNISSQACSSKSITKDCFLHLLSEFLMKSFSLKEKILNFLHSTCTSSLNYQSSMYGSNIETAVCAFSLRSKLFINDDAEMLENGKQMLLMSTTLVILHDEVQVIKQALKTIQKFYSAKGSKKICVEFIIRKK